MTSLAEHDWLAESSGGPKDVVGFFSAIGVTLPDRQTDNTAIRCFANPAGHEREDRNPSCSVSLISGAWNCRGCGERGNAYRAAQVMGYEDKAAARLARQYGLFMEVGKAEKPKLPGERQLKKWRASLAASPAILARLQELKGWVPETVMRLGLGWDGERVTFPIRTRRLKIAGVVRYLPGGSPKVLALPGTKRELFPVPEIIGRHHTLFVVEGEGDAVAVWSLGLRAVAVPGAGSWRREWAQRFMGRRVVVLADCDSPGRALAERISSDVSGAEVVDLEPGLSDGSDIGDWVRRAAGEGGLGQLRRMLEAL